jgi:GNAT superfamily N-acetyltransferase
MKVIRSRTTGKITLICPNSLCFGVFTEAGEQVGLARVVMDYATFAWICDVFIAPAHRGRGLSKWLEC